MLGKFFIFALLSIITFFATDSLAQQPGCPNVESVRREHLDADDYTELQQNAPEQLQIKVLTVYVWRVHKQNTFNKKFFPNLPPILKSDEVSIEVEITEVKSSKSGLKSGNVINIHYTTNQNYIVLFKTSQNRTIGDLENWEAISPLLMEVNKEYKVFVKRVQVQNGTDTDDGYRYVPVAYSKSFEEVKVEASNKTSAK